MSKIVLVETISMFRHVYAVELNDDEPNDYAVDDVVYATTGGDSKLEEFAQEHVSENIFSHRVISEEEYIRMFDEMNGYMSGWAAKEKKKFIFKRENHREVDFGPDVGKEVVE